MCKSSYSVHEDHDAELRFHEFVTGWTNTGGCFVFPQSTNVHETFTLAGSDARIATFSRGDIPNLLRILSNELVRSDTNS